MELFLAPEAWPFTVAVLLLAGIAAVEGIALLGGFSVAGWIDHLLPPPDVDGLADSWLGWLQVGRVPLLVLLVVLLTAFALLGFTLNALVHDLLGFYPPAILSSLVAFLGALPLVRASGAAIARLIPRDETSAVTLDSLVGRVAVVVNGTARANYPAEARVKNEHGQTLYVRVEPDLPNEQFGPGASVLLVKQVAGTHFRAIANPYPELL
jgi:hypothetical protein